jgi:hypothetical protein
VIWYTLCAFGTLCVHLVHFVCFWYNLCAFGTLCVHLVHFVCIWYIFHGFGIISQEKSGNPGSRLLCRFMANKIFRAPELTRSALLPLINVRVLLAFHRFLNCQIFQVIFCDEGNLTRFRMHLIAFAPNIIFVERSSTKERYRQPPLKFGNNCQPHVTAPVASDQQCPQPRPPDPARTRPPTQFFNHSRYQCQMYNFQSSLNHRANACSCFF